MDRRTSEFYETRSADYERGREPKHQRRALAFGGRRPEGIAIDLGSGPGWYTTSLGRPVVALDGALAMVRRTREVAPLALGVQADLHALPFRRGALAAAWARNTYVHLRAADVPLALGDLHRSLAHEAPVELTLFRGTDEGRGIFRTTTSPIAGSRRGRTRGCTTSSTGPGSRSTTSSCGTRARMSKASASA